ncbi:alanine racemase [Eleftheria terrae]|uniref:alanine racemase n=1 Tax=Eleftheria terrae TaxID=1597781 RepID=UPI00263AA281|nr:alanine racemase [Eleftheria terrae]WKB55403.1 alanine racemase [Eleftheria terrae]
MAERRRRLLKAAGAAALLAGVAAALRPADRGAPHAPYFATLQRALAEAGLARPAIVIDRERLQHNLGWIGARARQQGLPLRVVVKSLPSLALLDAACAAWQTQRAMLFNAEQLVLVARQRPQLGLLLGKPLPVAAARHAAQVLAERGAADALDRIEWLVDTPARLQQYRELAAGLGRPLKLNIEIDVGLHRGGVESPRQLAEMLAQLRSEPHLRWSGLMGYDAHVMALPDLAGTRQQARQAAEQSYQRLWDAARQALPGAARDTLTLNTGGSGTFQLHDRSGVANEVAVGSAAVKPVDFDLSSLAELQAAAFIATPVLKDLGPFRLPQGAGWLSAAARAWDRNQARAFAIHGGHWLADVVSPAGLAPSGLFGASSNQQVMVASAGAALRPDEWAFLRPRQSEAVLLQFGELVMVEGGRVVSTEPVFPVSA